MTPRPWSNMTPFMPPATFATSWTSCPSACKVLANGGGDAGLDLKRLTLGPDARSFDSLLECHAVVDDVDDGLEHRREDSRRARSSRAP